MQDNQDREPRTDKAESIGEYKKKISPGGSGCLCCLCCTVRTKGKKPGQTGHRSKDKVHGMQKKKVPVVARFSALAQADSWTHPPSYTMGLFPGGKAAGAWR